MDANDIFITPTEVEVFTKIRVNSQGAPNAIGKDGRLIEFDRDSSVITLSN